MKIFRGARLPRHSALRSIPRNDVWWVSPAGDEEVYGVRFFIYFILEVVVLKAFADEG